MLPQTAKSVAYFYSATLAWNVSAIDTVENPWLKRPQALREPLVKSSKYFLLGAPLSVFVLSY